MKNPVSSSSRNCRFDLVFEHYRCQINAALAEHVQSADGLPHEAHAALRYCISVGGKRVRPTITLLACESIGGSAKKALGVAVAAELLHTATLIYDDMIDDDKFRRGQPAVHVKFGRELAIITAGMLTSRAFHLVMHDTRLVGHVVNTMDELGVGEVLEIRGETKDVRGCLSVIEKKTAAMFRLCADLGALMGTASPAQQSALRDFAYNFGIAFQLRDDVLDVVGDEKKLGKPVGSDIRNRRPSIVSVLLCEQLGISLKELASQADKKSALGRRRSVLRAVKQATALCDSYVSTASSALQKLPESVHLENMHNLLHHAATRER